MSYVQKPGEAFSAREVLDAIGSPQIIEKPIVQYHFDDESNTHRIDTGRKTIVRSPIPYDKTYAAIGDVSHAYETVTPDMFAEVLDGALGGRSISTMLFPANGSKVLASVKLNEFEVGINGKRDQVDNYLVVLNPMDGNGAVKGFIGSNQVVCFNAIPALERNAVYQFRIPHFPGVVEEMTGWLNKSVAHAEITAGVLAEAYDVLGKRLFTDDQMKTVIRSVYPDKPRPEDPNDVLAWEGWNKRMVKVERIREAVSGLWNGAGTGHGTWEGTQWGALSCFTEFETYRRGTQYSMATNILQGDRANRVRSAYDMIAGN
jgi:hypothetical protein